MLDFFFLQGEGSIRITLIRLLGLERCKRDRIKTKAMEPLFYFYRIFFFQAEDGKRATPTHLGGWEMGKRASIYTDNNGELMTLMQREMADDNRHLRSMEAFINHVQGKPVMIADAEQGYIIQQLVAALYQSAETGTRVEL